MTVVHIPIVAAAFAFIITMIISPYIIRFLEKRELGQNVRSDGPKRHKKKSGTPTMGGVIILIAITMAVLIMNRNHTDLLFAVFIMLAFGAIGFIDDLLKHLTHSSVGLKARHKLFGQIFIGVLVAIYALTRDYLGTTLLIPFTELAIDIPVTLFVLLIVTVMVGTANAVNLTDGLDGLVAVTMAVAAVIYAVVSYVLGNMAVTLFAGAIVGACLGFAWFNAHPASIFMGDTGSLALGAALAIMAVLTKTELLLLIIGGLFVLETLSVILQVIYFRISGGRRLFKMAPLHHHFELSGWEEPKVMIRFWLISLILGMLGLLAVL